MKFITSILAAAVTLSACADYAITSRAKGGSVMSGGAGYDYGSTRPGGGSELSFQEISDACTARSVQNGVVGALFFAPVPGSTALSAGASVALGTLSFVSVTHAISSFGYAECMGMNYGLAIAPTNSGGFGFRVDDEQAKIWNSLNDSQRARAAKFIEAGGTVQSALLPD